MVVFALVWFMPLLAWANPGEDVEPLMIVDFADRSTLDGLDLLVSVQALKTNQSWSNFTSVIAFEAFGFWVLECFAVVLPPGSIGRGVDATNATHWTLNCKTRAKEDTPIVNCKGQGCIATVILAPSHLLLSIERNQNEVGYDPALAAFDIDFVSGFNNGSFDLTSTFLFYSLGIFVLILLKISVPRRRLSLGPSCSNRIAVLGDSA